MTLALSVVALTVSVLVLWYTRRSALRARQDALRARQVLALRLDGAHGVLTSADVAILTRAMRAGVADTDFRELYIDEDDEDDVGPMTGPPGFADGGYVAGRDDDQLLTDEISAIVTLPNHWWEGYSVKICYHPPGDWRGIVIEPGKRRRWSLASAKRLAVYWVAKEYRTRYPHQERVG